MTATIHPITPSFVAEIGDVDLSCPLDPADVSTIKCAFWKFAVLIFPDQQLSVEEHLQFAKNFGALETTAAHQHPGLQSRVRAEIADVSNLNEQNEVWNALRTTYHPAVLYRAKLIVFSDQEGTKPRELAEKDIRATP